jgi:chromatin segregation and condensation protein Rec8/ScpA/Scc1 (kleisin family)
MEHQALSIEHRPMEHQALSIEHRPMEHQALSIEQTKALGVELSSRHDKDGEESSDSELSIGSDLIMTVYPHVGSPAAEITKPVLNARSIIEIAEEKNISIKTPVHNHNPQRQGLEDNLFDFGDTLLDYTSDGETIRINRGLATFMLIAATAELPNKLLIERKREAFDQVTAQAQDLLMRQRQDYEKQREAIALQHQEVKKTRELYSQAYQQFEVTPPQEEAEESRAFAMQSLMAKNYQKKAERYKADYEVEAKKRQQKEKDLEEAEEHIRKLRDEIASLEDSFEVVVKRPLLRSNHD